MTDNNKSHINASCYCNALDEEFRRKHGIPNGYCGICQKCGSPGHIRHFPGPVPYTGAWCDDCYHVLKWTWIFRLPIGWIILALIAVLMLFLLSQVLHLF